MKILLTGLCSVHWGRIENGNIGNYYIVEVTVRELHRVFPHAEILTTFQMTDKFIEEEKVTVLPLDLYYNWAETDVENAIKEYAAAEIFQATGNITYSSPYIDLIRQCDLVCDFSGEMWGDHAEPVGENRFLVNLLKMRVAQLFNVKTVLLAGSQGPFVLTDSVKSLAKTVYKNFSKILNREAASIELLDKNGFDVSKSLSFTDPAFLFEPCDESLIKDRLVEDNIIKENEKTIGFVLCGFNMLQGPYDREPRTDDEFTQFAELVEYIVNDLGARVFFMSHQNGFEMKPNFKFINGRDYPYAKQLHEVVAKRGKADMSKVICAKGPYNARETKAIINKFDMFISGRIHAFVAAVSQCVPTVIINRGFGGISHRNIGFAKSVGMEDFVSNPASIEDMKEKTLKCWNNKEELRKNLIVKIPEVKNRAHNLFDSLSDLF
jgi:colanic acid/amylovoran biosynthesis protein